MPSLVLRTTRANGTVKRERVPTDGTRLELSELQLAGVSDNVAELTRVTSLRVSSSRAQVDW